MSFSRVLFRIKCISRSPRVHFGSFIVLLLTQSLYRYEFVAVSVSSAPEITHAVALKFAPLPTPHSGAPSAPLLSIDAALANYFPTNLTEIQLAPLAMSGTRWHKVLLTPVDEPTKQVQQAFLTLRHCLCFITAGLCSFPSSHSVHYRSSIADQLSWGYSGAGCGAMQP